MLDAHAGQYLPIDTRSGARKQIDLTHSKIHDGKHFTLSYNKTLSAGSAITVMFTSPATAVGTIVHFVGGVESPKSGVWTFSEAPEASAGSALTAYNNNRLSSNTSPLTCAGTVAWTSSGSVFETHFLGTASPASTVGGDRTSRQEYILNYGTKYLIRFIADAATTNTVINASFYYE